MEGGLIVSAKILCLTDLHKRYNESVTIKGLLEVQQLIQEEIIEYVKTNEVTHVIILGDWYHRGFHGLGRAYGAIEMDRRLSEAVGGNVFLCVGNHFYLERDENPEMYIIQPNDYIRPSIEIPMPEKPIFKVVPNLKIGTVQIDFFHYNKLNKEYVAYRDEDTTMHIGIYHDDHVLPSWVREAEGFTGETSQTYLNRIYSNIDLAIHGHIHTKLGTVALSLLNGNTIPLIIPGALTPTANKENQKHTTVDLPVLNIKDDSTVSIEYAEFATHVDKLRFADKKTKKKKLRDTGIVNAELQAISSSNDAELKSLSAYLNKLGHDQVDLNIIDLARKDNLILTEVLREVMNMSEVL